MLKFLTHKLRTHSLNEDHSEKVDGRDSGTESDDEVERANDFVDDLCAESDAMKWNDITDISAGSRASSASPAESACSACSGLVAPPPPAPRAQPMHPDLMYDHHSSEEELEVINGAPEESYEGGEVTSRRRGASSPGGAAPEKRKWCATASAENAPGASSDDDDTKVETPVRFRTSPPLEALKPRRGRGRPLSPLALHNACPPHEMPYPTPALPANDASPRRRARHAPRRHRPCLDFDKMQQLKVRGVTSWRHHGGSHAGGELSVFCW